MFFKFSNLDQKKNAPCPPCPPSLPPSPRRRRIAAGGRSPRASTPRTRRSRLRSRLFCFLFFVMMSFFLVFSLFLDHVSFVHLQKQKYTILTSVRWPLAVITGVRRAQRRRGEAEAHCLVFEVKERKREELRLRLWVEVGESRNVKKSAGKEFWLLCFASILCLLVVFYQDCKLDSQGMMTWLMQKEDGPCRVSCEGERESSFDRTSN